jgi:hypothetical protein
MKGRLNLFQLAMVRWKALYPYNAVHVVRVPAEFDVERLRGAVEQSFTSTGLTGFAFDQSSDRYEYSGNGAVPRVALLPASTEPEAAIAAEIERQLNMPFAPDGAYDPFRVFALQEAGAFHIGIAYDHFVAGGDSIVLLLNDIVDRYRGRAPQSPPPSLYGPTHRELFRRHLGALMRGARYLPQMVSSCRHTVRPRYRDVEDGRNAFWSCRFESDEYGRLVAAARRWGVTVNDMLLSLLLLALDPMTRQRQTARRRTNLAVASIMNLRPDYGADALGAFGQFLGSFRIAHPVPAGASLATLARDVHAQTARVKREKLYLQNLAAMKVVNGWAWQLYSPAQRHRLYAKSYPVWAGVTSVNVNGLWRSETGETPPDYLRGVSTGPLSPLIVAATTCGNGMHAGLSYRTEAFSADNVVTLMADVRDRIRALP